MSGLAHVVLGLPPADVALEIPPAVDSGGPWAAQAAINIYLKTSIVDIVPSDRGTPAPRPVAQ
jgi:hypothetical protein